MSKQLLKIENLHANVGEKPILKGLNLNIEKGQVHVIMGPNGAGKSTLANIIMGHPSYAVTKGHIFFDGDDITAEKTEERARKGLFLSFQNPEEIPGVTMENFLRTAKMAITGENVKALAFRKQTQSVMQALDMPDSYSERYVNVGFSGGEKKKSEIFQMLMLQPKLAILDETDSGLDVDAVKIVSAGVQRFKNEENAMIIITHNTNILQNITPDCVHVLMDGKIVQTGGAELIEQINSQGFAGLEG